MERRSKEEDDLNLAEVKTVNLSKAFEKLQSQASGLVTFALQWRDLEDHLMSVKGNIEKRFIELQNRSVEIDERAKVVEAGEGRLGDLEAKVDGFRREIEVIEEELSGLRMLIEECTVKQRLKASELDEMEEALRKTQGELDLKGGLLAQREADLERHCVEMSEEMEHLRRAQDLRRELDEENERKRRDLALVQERLETRSLELTKTQGEIDSKGGVLAQLEADLERLRVEMNSVMGRAETRRRELDKEIERKERDLTLVQENDVECCKLLKRRSLELTKTQGKLDLKVEQLEKIKNDFQRHHSELTAEMKHLERIQTSNRELEEVIDMKRKDLAEVLDRTAECGNLLETRSLELTKTQGELEMKEEQLRHVKVELTTEMENLERNKTHNRELGEDIERKRKDLERLDSQQKQLEVVEVQLDSQKKLLETWSLQLVCKEKELQALNNEMEGTCQKMESKAKELEAIERLINERSGHCESIKLLIEEHTEELASKEKRHSEITEAIHKLSVEIALKETERNKQLEEGEKKIKDLNNTNEELISQVKMRQEQVSSITEAIKECTCELEAKRKHCDQVQSSITDLTVDLNLKSKQCKLNSVEKKIQKSLEDLQSTEEQHDKLKASLLEHEKGLELREKELIAREEKINEQDQKLQLAKQELVKFVEAYKVKEKQLVALTPGDIHKPTENSRKRGRCDDKSLSRSLDSATHVLASCTTGQETTYNFENQRSPENFKIDQIWAVYSDSDKGMPRKYAQIKRIDTTPEFKLHVAPLVLYRPPPNLTTHPVCCGRFKLKIGKAEVLVPSSFSHKVNAVRSSINRFEVYPGKGEIWALYKNCAETGEELEIVEIVETNEQSIQAILLTAKVVFNKFLYGQCLESKASVVDIPKTEVNRFSHQIPAFRRDRRAARSGDCEWWELDPKAVLDLNSKKP